MPEAESDRGRGTSARRVALVAGEASGDALGAGLIRELSARMPGTQFAGIGGPHMRDAGMDTWWPSDALAVMGLTEVLAHLPRLLRLRAELRRRLLTWQPDIFIGIDAPDFNLAVERALKSRGVRTIHYVSPSVWAWRSSRAARIGRSADRVLCLFPMEPGIYAEHDVDAVFVGHPLADAIPLTRDVVGARARLEIALDAHVLALLPGSRASEIDHLAPIFLDAAALLLAGNPHLLLIAPMANSACSVRFTRHLDAAVQRHPVLDSALRAGQLRVINGHAGDLLSAADAAVLASGTAALEALLAQCPSVVAYVVAPLTAWLVQTFGLVKSRFYSLPNVLADQELMPELLQDDCTAPRIAESLGRLLFQPEEARAAFAARCGEVHERLRNGADAHAADAVVELLEPGNVHR